MAGTQPKLQFENLYHIFNRGVDRRNIFSDQQHYLTFFELYARHVHPVADTYAYCLLPNHFHLMVRIKSEVELVESVPGVESLGGTTLMSIPTQAFSNFFSDYSRALHNEPGQTANLFQHLYGCIPITDDRQYMNVVLFIHQNPQRHRLCADFRNWEFSSFKILLSKEATFMERETVLGWFGKRATYEAVHGMILNKNEFESFAGNDYD
jgi:REP element-mobilizing transposase RayT